MKVGDVVNGIRHPIRRNDLEARRRRLGLSRVKLAKILDVDPTTVLRQERAVMTALWDYALRGVEAEAMEAKPALRGHQQTVDDRDTVADGMVDRGHRYTGEKMKAQKPRPRKAKPPPVSPAQPPLPSRSREATPPSADRVKAIADRAEARSRLQHVTKAGDSEREAATRRGGDENR